MLTTDEQPADTIANCLHLRARVRSRSTMSISQFIIGISVRVRVISDRIL